MQAIAKFLVPKIKQLWQIPEMGKVFTFHLIDASEDGKYPALDWDFGDLNKSMIMFDEIPT